jgi:hypothetical protein
MLLRIGVVVFRYVLNETTFLFTYEDCSEIYQVTGPVERFAGQIASHGFVVGELHRLFFSSFLLDYGRKLVLQCTTNLKVLNPSLMTQRVI